MGDKPGKKAKKPKPPELPKGTPADIRDFVDCKANTLDLKPGKQPWIPKPPGIGDYMPDPEATFEAGAQPGTINIKLTLGATMTVPASVKGGKLELDTSGIPIPGLGAKTKEWVDKLNESFEANGKKLGTPELKDGKISLTKEALAAAPAKGAMKAGVFPGIPAGAKVAGALLLGASLVPTVALLDAGDSTKTEEISTKTRVDSPATQVPERVAEEDNRAAAVAACFGVTHHFDQGFSELIFALLVNPFFSHQAITALMFGPGGPVSGTAEVQNDRAEVRIRINQMGTYDGLNLRGVDTAGGTPDGTTLNDAIDIGPAAGMLPFKVGSENVPCSAEGLSDPGPADKPQQESKPKDEPVVAEATETRTTKTDTPPWVVGSPIALFLSMFGIGMAFGEGTTTPTRRELRIEDVDLPDDGTLPDYGSFPPNQPPDEPPDEEVM